MMQLHTKESLLRTYASLLLVTHSFSGSAEDNAASSFDGIVAAGPMMKASGLQPCHKLKPAQVAAGWPCRGNLFVPGVPNSTAEDMCGEMAKPIRVGDINGYFGDTGYCRNSKVSSSNLMELEGGVKKEHIKENFTGDVIKVFWKKSLPQSKVLLKAYNEFTTDEAKAPRYYVCAMGGTTTAGRDVEFWEKGIDARVEQLLAAIGPKGEIAVGAQRDFVARTLGRIEDEVKAA